VSYTEGLLASGERVIRVAHQHWFVLVWRARWAILGLIIAVLAGGFAAFNASSGPLWTILGWVVLALLVIGVVSLIWGALTFRAQEFVITNRRVMHVEGVINKKASDSSLEKINDAVLTESIFGRMFGYGNLEVLTASESGIEKLQMLRDAKAFKKSMLEAKHELEIELTRPTMPPMRTTESTSLDTAPEPAVASAPAPAPAPLWAAAGAAPAGAAVADVPAIRDEPAVPAPPPAAPASAAGAASSADTATSRVDTADEVANALSRLGALRDQGVITPEEFEAKKAELLGRL
jgi:hypothetical protein